MIYYVLKVQWSLRLFCFQKIEVSIEYVTDLLYNGFYCFEAVTERNLDETICGICGVLGEVYFGDGNEKNCCSRKEVRITFSFLLYISLGISI